MDVETLTGSELVDRVRGAFEPTDPRHYLDALDEIERRLNAPEQEIFVLPVSVTEAIRNQFGSGKRTFDAMTKRVRFAYKVWQGKYGPWSPEQAEYAEELILFCVNKASLAVTPGHARASVYTWLDRIIHHENTHEGFKRREGETFSVLDELKEVLDAG